MFKHTWNCDWQIISIYKMQKRLQLTDIYIVKVSKSMYQIQ